MQNSNLILSASPSHNVQKKIYGPLGKYRIATLAATTLYRCLNSSYAECACHMEMTKMPKCLESVQTKDNANFVAKKSSWQHLIRNTFVTAPQAQNVMLSQWCGLHMQIVRRATDKNIEFEKGLQAAADEGDADKTLLESKQSDIDDDGSKYESETSTEKPTNFQILYEAEFEPIAWQYITGAESRSKTTQEVLHCNDKLTLTDVATMGFSEDEIKAIDKLPADVQNHYIDDDDATSETYEEEQSVAKPIVGDAAIDSGIVKIDETIEEMVPNIIPPRETPAPRARSKYPKIKPMKPDSESPPTYWGMSNSGSDVERDEIEDIEDNDTVSWKWK